MTQETAPIAKALRHTIEVAKWEDGRTPDDGEPDATERIQLWTEPNGAVIDDPARIVELEASLKGNGDASDHGGA